MSLLSGREEMGKRERTTRGAFSLRQRQPTGSGFITKSTFDVAEQATERMFENTFMMCTDLVLNWREKALYNKLGPN